jgi:hypothetical protein
MTTISETLKYANLQIAAEAFLQNAVGNKVELIKALIAGNKHVTKFAADKDSPGKVER